jgi:metal-dependent HD superfamily phosphatase/phosphodiesterase
MRRVLPIRKLAHANVAVACLRTPQMAPLVLSLEGGLLATADILDLPDGNSRRPGSADEPKHILHRCNRSAAHRDPTPCAKAERIRIGINLQ